MSFDSRLDEKNTRHFRTRAVGQLYLGPIQAEGYDNRVMQLTLSEMEFKSSTAADRFLDHQRRKYSTTGQLCRSNRLRHISRGDDN